MLYIYGILIAVQIVLGQVLWKIGVGKTHFVLTKKFILSDGFLKTITSPYIIVGVLSYGLATLLFMAMLGKYQYTNLQAVVVSSSLITTFLAAIVIFHEKVGILNFFGLFLLILGAIFITRL